jgi:hypothetical protein
MGYSTDFYGVLKTDKEIPAKIAAKMRELSETDTRDITHGGDHSVARPSGGFPGFHCDFAPTDDNHGIRWNGSEKTYDAVEWIDYLVRTYLGPNGITIPDGQFLDAQGEEHGDTWRLTIINGRPVQVNARLVYEYR